MTAKFKDASGFWTFYKDPDDKNFYSGDITAELTDRGTTATSVTEIVLGVTVLTPTVLQTSGGNTACVVKLTGLDVTISPINQCTFRVICANGEQFDKTIKFLREDH